MSDCTCNRCEEGVWNCHCNGDEDFEDDWLSEDELAAQDVARPKDIDGLIEKIRGA